MMIGKNTGRASSIPAGLAWGIGAALAITVLGSGGAAWLVLGGRLPAEWIGYCAMVILALSSGCGAAVAISKIQRLRAQMGLAAGGLYYLCLVIATALFFGGQYRGMGVTALMVLCGCDVVILLSPGTRQRHGRRRHKIRK